MVLSVFVLLEIGLVAHIARIEAEPKALRGYLIKNGKVYHVAWRDEQYQLRSRTYNTLHEALNFAQGELRLSDGQSPNASDSLEFLDVKERLGTYVLMFKTLNFSFLHHMTFYNRAEAQYFLSAFKRGHYSASPLGHAIPLTPISEN